MRHLITKKQKHLLWKDEQGDEFILLKHCEIFENDENTLRIHAWNYKGASEIKKLVPILSEDRTDDPLWIFVVNKDFLSPLAEAFGRNRRLPRNGKWLKDKEIKLSHRILPTNPQLGDAGR